MPSSLIDSRPLLMTCLLVFGLSASACRKPAAAVEVEREAPIEVNTTEVSTVEVPKILRLTGTLRGAKQTDLAANVAGRVQATLVERGTQVKRGTVLARVDVSQAALALAEARVQVETFEAQQQISQSECERYELLRAKGAVTDLEYDRVTAKCKMAPLEIQAAKARQTLAAKNVNDGVIRAPFDGVVIERHVEVGEYVQSSSPVVAMAQVDALRLEFSLPEANYSHVRPGASVTFRVVAYPERPFQGTVTHISGAVRDTRDVLVEAQVENTDGKLAPGMFADVELTLGTQTLPAIPQTAVFQDNGKPNAFIVTDARLEQRVLQTERPWRQQVPVLRGVSVGERVVVAPEPHHYNGQPVK